MIKDYLKKKERIFSFLKFGHLGMRINFGIRNWQ